MFDVHVYSNDYWVQRMYTICPTNLVDTISYYFDSHPDCIIVLQHTSSPRYFCKGSWVSPEINQIYGWGFSEDINLCQH